MGELRINLVEVTIEKDGQADENRKIKWRDFYAPADFPRFKLSTIDGASLEPSEGPCRRLPSEDHPLNNRRRATLTVHTHLRVLTQLLKTSALRSSWPPRPSARGACGGSAYGAAAAGPCKSRRWAAARRTGEGRGGSVCAQGIRQSRRGSRERLPPPCSSSRRASSHAARGRARHSAS
eukprot:scaffold265645_cov23-Tisochrysis_lutea.AAC.1